MEITNGTYCVYVHINKANGKMYVGQTRYGDNPNRRWMNGYGYQEGTYFRNAINKYGWNNFEHEIIASYLTKTEADNFETMLIKTLHTNNQQFGYNLTYGGEGSSGYKMSKENKKKISESHKNKPLGDLHKQAIANAHIGKSHADDHIDKISQGHMSRRCKEYENIYHIAQYTKDGVLICVYDSMTEASNATNVNINDIQKSLMGRLISVTDFIWTFVEKENVLDIININGSRSIHKNSKGVCQYDKDYNLLKEWNSITEAANALKINKNNIWKCCNNIDGRKSAGGFLWTYKVDAIITQND